MNSKPMQSLVGAMLAKEQEAQKAAQAAAEKEGGRKLQIAAAFDAATAALPASPMPRPLPWFVMGHDYKHTPSKGHMSFKGLTFEDVAQMMRDYPALPQVRYRSSARHESGIRHAGYLPEHADTQSETDGYELHISQGIGYGPTVSVQWDADLGGMIVGIHAELKGGRFTPRLHANCNRWQDKIVSIDGTTARIVYPFGDISGLHSVRYAQGSRESYPDFLVWGVPSAGGMLRYVDSIAAENLRLQTESFAAYLADKQSGHLRAETGRSIPGMSAGSPAQNAALGTDAALQDRALADKHWGSYCRDSDPDQWPVKSSQAYFDHYAWACKWLAGVGFLDDPSFLRKNGKPYRYGSAWINAAGLIHGED